VDAIASTEGLGKLQVTAVQSAEEAPSGLATTKAVTVRMEKLHMTGAQALELGSSALVTTRPTTAGRVGTVRMMATQAGNASPASLATTRATAKDTARLNMTAFHSKTSFKMPLYRVVSPRTRKRIGLLPKPTADDEAVIEAVERGARQQPLSLDARKGLYKVLHRTQEGAAMQEDDLVKDQEDIEAELGTDLRALEEAEAAAALSPVGRKRKGGEASPSRSPKRTAAGGAPVAPEMSVLVGVRGPPELPEHGPVLPETAEVIADTEALEVFNQEHEQYVDDCIERLRAELMSAQKVRSGAGD
jgi:hypothetical protein